MSLIRINWDPTTRQLRQFSGLCVLLLPLLAWLGSCNATAILSWAGIGLLILGVAVVYPKGILPLYVVLTLVTAPIGIVVGEVALFLVFMVVFLPIGLIFRIISRDRLCMKIDRQAASYWQPKPAPRSVASYYRQS